MSRFRTGLVVVAVTLVLVVWVLPLVVRKPMARLLERRANAALDGYAVHIEAADLRPLRAAVRLRNVVVQDTDRSEPPIGTAPAVDAGVALAGLRLSAWAILRDPVIEVDAARLREIARVRLAEQLQLAGHRSVARLARYGASLGDVEIENGRAAWQAPDGSIALAGLSMDLENDVRPRPRGPDDRYRVAIEGRIGDTGRVAVGGRLAPFAQGNAPAALRFDVQDVPLPAFAAAARAARIDLHAGELTTSGRMRVAKPKLDLRIRETTLADADADWTRRGPSWSDDLERLRRLTRQARTLSRGWEPTLRAERVTVARTTIGVVDRTHTPTYRAFFVTERATMRDVAVPPGPRPARVTVVGKPMGTGVLDLDAVLRGTGARADVACRLGMKDVSLPEMNDVIRAYGGPELATGRFELALDATVRDGRIAGYAKPFFGEMEAEPDPDAGLGEKMTAAIVAGVTGILENESDEIATRTTLSGTLANPEAGVWEAAVGLLRNAFVEAIQPGFDRAMRAG